MGHTAVMQLIGYFSKVKFIVEQYTFNFIYIFLILLLGDA